MKQSLVYILSPSFSGSTLLTFLLAQHEEISTVGELKAVHEINTPDYACSCGEMIRDCWFWNALVSRCQEQGVDLLADGFTTAIRGSTTLSDKLLAASVRGRPLEVLRKLGLSVYGRARRELRDGLQRNSVIADSICELQGGRVFLDGSKTPVRLKHYIDSGLWDIRVIHLTRDGRGVVCSNMSNLGMDFAAGLARWKHAQRETLRLRERLPSDRVIDLRYEDLCNDPAGSLARITAFAEISEYAPKVTGFKQHDSHIIGNRMRLGSLDEIRLNEKWRTLLDEARLATFQSEGGELNAQLGYGPDR